MDTVDRVAARLFIPLTVGGGVRTIEDARRLLSSGADKVAVNTAAVETPELISEIAAQFGRQAVVVAIDVRRIKESKVVRVRHSTSSTRLVGNDWSARAMSRKIKEPTVRARHSTSNTRLGKNVWN